MWRCSDHNKMKPGKTSLFLLLFLTLLRPSQLYSLKHCHVEFENSYVCSYKHLNSIPTDIPKTATDISVYGNDIQRIKQSDLSGFYKLKRLNLENNNISHIEEGAFSDVSSLTKLGLSFNKLTLLTDNMFKGLSNLSFLDLRNNKINSISKFAFEPLNNLQILDLSNNYLVQSSDITNILIHCPLLKTLNLMCNKITSFPSYKLPFPVLKTLNLRENNLTLFEPENSPFLFLNLTELVLTLSGRFSVHSDVFPRLESLILTSVSESSIIEWDISDKAFFRSLTSLDLIQTTFTIQTYRLLFKLVDSVDELYLAGIGRLFDKGLLDFACGIPSLRQLDLRFNHILILNDSLLQSCNNLTDLNLSDNSMTDMTEDSLRMLTKLTRLNLDSNNLSRIPTAIRNMTTLKYLSCDFNKIRELKCFDFLNLLSLRSLSFNSNAIVKIRSCVFRSLTNLENLNVRANRLFQLDIFGVFLPKLNHLYFSENSIGWLYKGIFQNLSSLTLLDLESIQGTLIEGGAFEGLYNLTNLYLSTNVLKEDTFAGLPRLERLSLSLHYPKTWQISPTASLFNLSSLQKLDVKVTSETCYPLTQNVFKGLGNLRTLNSKRFLCLTPHQDTFIYTPHLEQVYIGDNYEFDASPELFHPLTELKTLYLSHNTIKSVDFLSNANLTKLETLNLNLNEIKVVNETVFKALPSLKYLDLSGNPFVCNCSNAGFIDWAIRNKQVQVVDAFQYRCSSPPSEEGHFLMDFNVQSCWESASFLCFMSSSALVLLTLLTSFIYHFLRWQLVYGFYLLQAFLYDSKKRKQGCPYIYDAFVSYNVQDEDWVYRELMPELEGQQGWRLCLHQRDFEPGKAIIENITDAIYSSRKTLCVISRRYLQSEWCSREIQMASFRLFDEQKDVLILLFLEEISSNQLSPFYRMRKLVKSRTYLSWTQARNHKGLFWEKVRRALECGTEPADNNDPLTANV